MIFGKCNCGEVSFEVTTQIKDIYFCHCSICRRNTGSNGIAVVVVNNENFRWLKGENSIKTWTKPNHDWQTSFCTDCGSSLPGKNDDTRVYIPVGLLPNDNKTLKVTHHIWVGSKANWDEIGEDGVKHLEAFTS
jgi:hypothetical protein